MFQLERFRKYLGYSGVNADGFVAIRQHVYALNHI